jgi:hypothetical protein
MGYIVYVSFPACRKNYDNNSNEYSSFQYPVFLSDRSDAGQGQSGIYTNIHPAGSHFTLLVAERNTPCTSVCLAMERGTHCTARLCCWWWKKMYTPCTAGCEKEYTLVLHMQYILLAKGCGGEVIHPAPHPQVAVAGLFLLYDVENHM